MAVRVKDGFRCAFCGKTYVTSIDADTCYDSHDLVFLAILRSDLDRLLKFLYTGSEDLITETMMKSLRVGLGKMPKNK